MDVSCWKCVHRDNFEILICGNCCSDEDGVRDFFKERNPHEDQSSKFELGTNIKHILEKYPTMVAEAQASGATYTLNCEVCGKVIYRKNGFDTRCDEHQIGGVNENRI